MAENNYKYCNFPVSLLRYAFTDIENTISRIFRYSVYKHTKNLEHGTELEKMLAAADFFNIQFGNNNDDESLRSAIKAAKEVISEYDLSAPNVSVKIKVLWDFRRHQKSEFEIACFCAFCAIKSILGNKPYAKTNKSLIIARMFGGVKSTPKEEAPADTFNLNSARAYLAKQHGEAAPSVATVRNAIKKGDLKANMDEVTATYVIDIVDLDRWYTAWSATVTIPNTALQIIATLKEKYTKRHHIDKVLLELRANWELKLYSDHARGFYLSFSKSLEDLALINELGKTKVKTAMMVSENAKAKEAAVKKISEMTGQRP